MRAGELGVNDQRAQQSAPLGRRAIISRKRVRRRAAAAAVRKLISAKLASAPPVCDEPSPIFGVAPQNDRQLATGLLREL